MPRRKPGCLRVAAVDAHHALSYSFAAALRGPQPGILLLELRDALLQLIDRLLDVLGEEHLRDVLRAIHIPRLEREEDDLLQPGRGSRRG